VIAEVFFSMRYIGMGIANFCDPTLRNLRFCEKSPALPLFSLESLQVLFRSLGGSHASGFVFPYLPSSPSHWFCQMNARSYFCRKVGLLGLTFLLICILFGNSTAQAMEDLEEPLPYSHRLHYRPFEVALFSPVHIFHPPNKAIAGIGLTGIYGFSTKMLGLQLGLGIQHVTTQTIGIQITGVSNWNEGDFVGFQFSLWNRAQRMFGFQIGGVGNLVFGDAIGLQVGLFNHVGRHWRGVQIGVLNWNQTQWSKFSLTRLRTLWTGQEGPTAGLQLGAVNWAHHLVGIQLGLGNLAEGTVVGLQISGSNYANRGLKGVQIGTVNFTWYKARGLQLLGVVQIAKRLDGAQIGGFNFIYKSLSGAQIGFSNVVADLYGFQVGVMNFVRRVEGAQIGVFNVARRVRGVQIGVFNFTRKLRGLQLGLLNFAFREKIPFVPIVNMRL